MMQSDRLVYSNNLCSAFMAAIVASYARLIGGRHYLGRTAVQKLVYFAKALGVPAPCSFEIHTYGPYSYAVTFSVDSMLADDVLKDVSKELELVATLHFIHHRLKQIWLRDPQQDQVLDEFRRVKHGKFSETEIEVFYHALKNAKLI